MFKHSKTLISTYEKIWQDTLNRALLLREDISRTLETLVNTESIPYKGEGLALQIRLDQPGGEELKKLVLRFQEEIHKINPRIKIYTGSVESLHVTIFPFYKSVDNAKLSLATEEHDHIASVVKAQQSFLINFTGLNLSKGDFILEGIVNSDALQTIRNGLADRFSECEKPTMLVHISVARILQPVPRVRYKRYKKYVEKRRNISSLSLEVFELSLVRHFDSMSAEFERKIFPLRVSEDGKGSVLYGLSQRKKSFPTDHLLVVVVKRSHRDYFHTHFLSHNYNVIDCVQEGWSSFSFSGKVSDQKTNIVIFGQKDEMQGTVCATANSMRMVDTLEKTANINFKSTGIILAGGQSTRNFALAPHGNKGLIPFPGGKTFVDIAIEKASNFLCKGQQGTFVFSCDELIVLDDPLVFDSRKFSVIGGKISIDDPYIASCGCCSTDSKGSVKGFYEKRGNTELSKLFPSERDINVSWNSYFIPPALKFEFMKLFEREADGEFSRMIEASYADLESEWVKKNPSYSISFFRASKMFIERSGGAYNFVCAGPKSYFRHIGSNLEYYNFCMDIFDSSFLRQLLGVVPTEKNQIIDLKSIVGNGVVLGNKVIICGNSTIQEGECDHESVIVNTTANKIYASRRSLIANIKIDSISVDSNLIKGRAFQHDLDNQDEIVCFPLHENIKQNKALYAKAISTI